MDRNTEALVAAILTIAKFLPNVTYPAETVATEFQQMLEAVRKIGASPEGAAEPPDAGATAS
jgi:hypothetical protein